MGPVPDVGSGLHPVSDQTLVGGEGQRRMRAFLAMGGQTEAFERAGFEAALETLAAIPHSTDEVTR